MMAEPRNSATNSTVLIANIHGLNGDRKKKVSLYGSSQKPRNGIALVHVPRRQHSIYSLEGKFNRHEFGRRQVTVSLGNFLQYSPSAFVVCVFFFPVKRLGRVLIFELRTLLRL